MNVVVTTEHRFLRTPDGAVWTDGINSYEFWVRYLSVFDRVKVLARVKESDSRPAAYRAASGPGVVFRAVPNYEGPWEYIARNNHVRRAIRGAVDASDAVIMRVSSHIAGCLESCLVRAGHPYGLEVVNDPYDVFAPGAVQYHLRPVFRWWFTRQLRRQCRQAIGVAYVTEQALQARYPCSAYSAGLSDVEISHENILEIPPVFTTHRSTIEPEKGDSIECDQIEPKRSQPFHIVTVASLAQMYKAPDVLIRAVAECIHRGIDLHLRIAGDGKHRPELERLVASLRLGGRVEFLGQVPAGIAVREELDRSDLFVLASRCEGLPRAMAEAMARALPCIGSTVGGIPELLPSEDLVPPGNVTALADKIQEVLSSPARMRRMSARNLARAQEYRDDVLAERRRAFFTHIRQTTAAWLASSRTSRSVTKTESAEYQ
jgi:glycosyltransferase involved in cell wall biosynthesis